MMGHKVHVILVHTFFGVFVRRLEKELDLELLSIWVVRENW